MHIERMHVYMLLFKESMVAKKNVLPKDDLTVTSQENGFPVPFSVEEFHDDVVTLFLHQLRQIAWMKDHKTAWLIVGKALADGESIFNPELSSADAGLTYADIQDTPFAQYLENMYQYAYFGILDESLEPVEYETGYTWMSALLYDMNRSMFLVEWESYGGDGQRSAARCLAVAELANARRVLEGGEGFSYFGGTREDDANSRVGALTIHQMALLAGMEEMSIRAAANPKRANPLPTFSEEGRTRIAIDAAKAWLQSKERYVPISRRYQSGNIDLAKRRFSSFDDLTSVITDRKLFLAEESEKRGHPIGTRMGELEAKHGCVWVDRMAFSNPDFVSDLANILDFPSSLFALRVREALAKEELAAVERALREMNPPSQ